MKQIIITVNEDNEMDVEIDDNLNLIEIAGLLKMATIFNDYRISKSVQEDVN
jgi:hypothetical protein